MLYYLFIVTCYTQIEGGRDTPHTQSCSLVFVDIIVTFSINEFLVVKLSNVKLFCAFFSISRQLIINCINMF